MTADTLRNGPGLNTAACLAELVSIERLLTRRTTSRGAASGRLQSLLTQDPTMSTELGQTSLHLAAAEGLRACTELLVHAAGGGANLYALDRQGHTPLELARIGCHKDTARYLKDCMWKQDKHTDMQRRKSVHKLRLHLIHQTTLNDHREKEVRRGLVEENVTQWANGKGLRTQVLTETPRNGPPSRYHRHCSMVLEPPGHQPEPEPEPEPERGQHTLRQLGGGPQERWNISTNPATPPRTSLSGPWAVRMGSPAPPRGAEPDLRSSVVLSRGGDGAPLYTTRWSGGVAVPAPHLPVPVLERLLFPGDFPSRMEPHHPGDFQATPSVLELGGRGRPLHGGQSGASPWTEVAMHLAEVALEPRHY